MFWFIALVVFAIAWILLCFCAIFYFFALIISFIRLLLGKETLSGSYPKEIIDALYF